MTLEERSWFEKLAKELELHAHTFGNPRYPGIWDGVINKYSNHGHFLYELLQNADDASATECEFMLSSGCLAFSHNGTKRFTVTNPDTEVEDRAAGKLGCLNSITSIGLSAKNFDAEDAAVNQIGKFGIGFKSVFWYTDNPLIYDDNVCFGLKQRIVPYEIPDIKDRVHGTTVFVLPFDRQDLLSTTAFLDIGHALIGLRTPVLFLNNLMKVKCSIISSLGQSSTVYEKSIVEPCCEWRLDGREPLCSRVVRLSKVSDGAQESMNIRLFSRANEDGREYCVGYKIDEFGRPVLVEGMNAFCYFQTEINTGLKFIVHAPFKLTDNRESIINENYNCNLLSKLALLSADAIAAFKKIGEEVDRRLIDDSSIDVLPDAASCHPQFKCFAAAFESLYKNFDILPTENGYTRFNSAYWPSSVEVMELLPDDKLSALLGRDVKWVFRSYPSESRHERARLVQRIMGSGFAGAGILNIITSDFIKRQDLTWLSQLYKFLMRHNNLRNQSLIHPLLLNQDGEAVPAVKSNGEMNIFMPIETDCEFQTVNRKLLETEDGRAFCAWIGLREPSRLDAVVHIVRARLTRLIPDDEYRRLFGQVLSYCCSDSTTWADKKAVREAIGRSQCLKARRAGECTYSLIVPDENTMYVPSERLESYFKGLDVWFVDADIYKRMVDSEHSYEVDSLLTELKVRGKLKYWKEKGRPHINCCCGNLSRIEGLPEDERRALSYNMWMLVSECLAAMKMKFTELLMNQHPANHGPSDVLTALRTKKWLMDKTGNMVSPANMWIEDIPAAYEPESMISLQMIQMLQMRRNPENVALEALPEDKRKALSLGQQMLQGGISSAEDVAAFVAWKQAEPSISLSPTLISEEEGTSRLPCAIISLADGQYAGLSRDQKRDVLNEAKKMARDELEKAGFVFELDICENDFSIINGVKKDGVEYPIVVHSYMDQSRQFQLNAADWAQLTKPNSMLIVRTQEGIGYVPFRELISNRERIDLSFSTKNLEIQDRLDSLASVMRWFEGLRFDFGSLIQPKAGIAQFFDLPEQGVDENVKQQQLLPDNAEGLF